MRPDSNKTFTLDDWRRGDPITARHFQQPITALKKLTSGVALPRQRPGVFAGPAAVAAAGLRIQRMTLTGLEAISWDTIMAVDSEGDEQIIAKPYDLRPGSNPSYERNGVVFTYNYGTGEKRTITHSFGAPDNVNVNQVEEVIPFYGTGDIYVVALAPGAIGDMFVIPGIPFGTTVKFLDMNNGGRAWGATKTTETPV